MSSFFFKRAQWLLLIVISTVATAQLLPQLTPSTNEPPKPAQDPLGRDTPYGTVFRFLQAVQTGNYSTAAQYLQMTNARRLSQGEDVASKLKVVMDRTFTGDLRRISNQPDGIPQEGVPLDRQRVGVLSAGDVEANLDLVRLSDPGGARIWLISSDTLVKVPDLYEQLQVRQAETRLPGFLVQVKLLEQGRVGSFFTGLYNYAWFVGFALAFAAYLLGRKLTSAPRPAIAFNQPQPVPD